MPECTEQQRGRRSFQHVLVDRRHPSGDFVGRSEDAVSEGSDIHTGAVHQRQHCIDVIFAKKVVGIMEQAIFAIDKRERPVAGAPGPVLVSLRSSLMF